MSAYKATKLPAKSNFDKRDRYTINGLSANLVIEAQGKGEGYDNDGAKTVAELIAHGLNIVCRERDEV